MALQALELFVDLLDKFEADGRSFVLAHLRDQFLVVQEEELYVDRLALFVSQEGNKVFEHRRERSRVVILKDLIDLVDNVLGDVSDLVLHLLLQRL